MADIIQTRTYPDYEQNVILDNVTYRLRLQWNQRELSWYLSLGLVGQSFTFKTKCVNGLDLLRPYRYMDSVPKGGFYIVDVEKRYGRVSYDKLLSDGRYRLVYITEQERLAAQ